MIKQINEKRQASNYEETQLEIIDWIQDNLDLRRTGIVDNKDNTILGLSEN
jgi:hypothetical protein